MNVLGLHYGSSDAGICILVPERKPIAVALERLDRIKYSGTYVKGWRQTYAANLERLLAYGAAGLGLELGDLRFDVVAHTRSAIGENALRDLLSPHVHNATTFALVNHHMAHACSAFFASPFEDAAILVVDGDGDRAVNHLYANAMAEKQSLYRGTGNDVTTISKTYGTAEVPCGLGFAYDIVTYHLNFGAIGEAGKTMGLASYGSGARFQEVSIFRRFADGDILMDPEFFHWPEWQEWGRRYDLEEGRGIIRTIPSKFGRVRQTGEQLPSEYYNEMAYKLQRELDDAMLELALRLFRITRSSNLCLAGGVALNCITNRRLLDETPFEKVFIQPAASDTGLALGAALYGQHMLGGLAQRWVMTDAYLGREYHEQEVRCALGACDGIAVEYFGPDKANPHFRSATPISEKVAQLLVDNRIVGWFQGGSEYGPRALGHRSILADPRHAENRDIVNARVKRREAFRPFAPSVLLEHAQEYFDVEGPAPFMILAAQAKAGLRDRIPAVVHVDNTARVQTVTREDNDLFYDLIERFYRLTGVPVVLNTSFNLAGEPIVETPRDALRSFMATDMDYLVIHNYLIYKQ